MPAFSQQFQRILLFDPDQARATVSVFFDTYTPEGLDTPCHVFLLSEIQTREHEDNQFFIREIQNTFFHFFVNKNVRMTESLFEEGLHAMNTLIPTLLHERSQELLQRLTFVAGTIYGNVMHFSQVGNSTMLFMHQGKILDIAERTVSEYINPLKVFQEIGTGKLEPSDSIFFGTTNFLDYFSQEKIRRLLEVEEGKLVSKTFEDHLKEAPLSASFAAIYLKQEAGTITSVDEYIKKSQNQPQPQKRMRSIEELIEREASTEEILAPKLLPLLYKKSKATIRAIRQGVRKYIFKKPTRVSPIIKERDEENAEKLREAYLRRMHHASKRPAQQKFTNIFSSIKATAGKTFQQASASIKKIRKNDSTGILGPQVSRKKEQFHLFRWFSSLSIQRKITVAILIIVIVAFAESMALIGARQYHEKRSESIEREESAIRNQIAEIEAAFLYDDDGRVRNAISAIELSLASIPDSEKNKAIREEAQAAINSAKNKLQRIVAITPTTLIDLRQQSEANTIVDLAYTGNALYTMAPESNRILRSDATSGETSTIQIGEGKIPQHLGTVGSTVIVIYQDMTIQEIRNESQSLTNVTSLFDQATNIAGIATYLNRLYLLDLSSDQILRANRGVAAYGAPSFWITEDGVSLTGAKSLAIDGSIYVGYSNGIVEKYQQGSRITFALDQLQDPISKLSQIWTDEDAEYLYVLDDEFNRIIQFTKDGGFIRQFHIQAPGSISKFMIDEKKAKAYILSEMTLLSFDIPAVE